MVSQGYRDWLAAGQPYTLIRPAAAVQRNLRLQGLVVYDYPNAEHQKANTPEDHTPYSATSWPISNARWRGHALDVMPRTGVPAAAANAENAAIARQLIRDRDAGVPGAMWIKYINWTDERGVCRQVRWQDGRSERSSTDKGHIHISGRSDCANDARADTYDPLARARAGVTGDDDMTPEQAATLGRLDGRMAALFYGMEGNPYGEGPMKDEPNQIQAVLARLEAASAADETRDRAMQAALTTIGKAITASGGNVSIAPVIEEIQRQAELSRAQVAGLHVELAAERAENADLRARLAAAFGPGSE